MARTVLCFGDSNTHGTMPMPALDSAGRFDHVARWPSVMAKALGPDWEVIAEGQPGRTTVHDDPIEGIFRNGARILPALLESHAPIDLVIVKLGTNDLKYRFNLSATDVALGVERLVSMIRASGAGPDGAAPAVLAVVPPPILEAGDLGEIFVGGAATSQGLATAFAKMAARNQLPLVDAGQIVAVSPVDGIHYEAEAHVALGLAMADVVREHFDT